MEKSIFELNEGDIFTETKTKHFYNKDSKVVTTYWKVTGTQGNRNGRHEVHYDVVKCNKNGKEFRYENGFTFNKSDNPKYHQEYKYFGTCAVTEKVKVSDTGIAKGTKTRRIKYLEETVSSMQKELEKLKTS